MKNNNHIITRIGDGDVKPFTVTEAKTNKLLAVVYDAELDWSINSAKVKLGKSSLLMFSHINREADTAEFVLMNAVNCTHKECIMNIPISTMSSLKLVGVDNLLGMYAEVVVKLVPKVLAKESGFTFILYPEFVESKYRAINSVRLDFRGTIVKLGIESRLEGAYIYQKPQIFPVDFNHEDVVSGEELFNQYASKDTQMLLLYLPGLKRHYEKLETFCGKSIGNKELIEELGKILLAKSEGVLLAEATIDPFTLTAYYQAVFGTRAFQQIFSKNKKVASGIAKDLLKKFPYKIPPINQVGYGLISQAYDDKLVSDGTGKSLAKPSIPVKLP